MPSLDQVYPEVRDALRARYGDSPGELDLDRDADPFAAIVVAWIGRTIDARNLSKARDGLRDAGLLSTTGLIEADASEVVEALKVSGRTFATKAITPLIRLARWAEDRGEEGLIHAPTESLRDDLRRLNGIGPATADLLLLNGLDRPSYPVDRPSYRVFARHGWIDSSADYDEARSVFENVESDDPAGLRRLASGLDLLASEFCRASRPKCERCPLRDYLPEGGPIEEDGVTD